MKIRDLGEAGLISRIKEIVVRHGAAGGPAAADSPGPAESPGASVLLGIGDDAALLAPALLTPVSPTSPREQVLIATSDMLIEGTHFLRPGIAPADLGHKALAASLSDVAAMGGRPLYALVSLALPGDLEVGYVDGFYAGFASLAAATGVAVVGGDTVGSRGPVVVDVTVIGEVLPGGPFRGDGARPGDAVLVTGSFGAAADRPVPRLREAAALAEVCRERGIRLAARDASDGLAAAALALAEASGCAMELDAAAIPVAREARAGPDPLELALYGGEDYELVLTVAESAVSVLREKVSERTGTPLTVVGRAAEGGGVGLRRAAGRIEAITRRGFSHF